MVYPGVCVDENLTTFGDNLLRMQRWAVPRLVVDQMANSGADGHLVATTELPGKLLINSEVAWISDSPVDTDILIRVTRGPKTLVTSNPNVIQFRDRWTRTINSTPPVPITSGIFNSECGSGIDLGTNSVAEPNPGKDYKWMDACSSDEWFGPLKFGQRVRVHYRCYVWTPPPFSDNANKNSPEHSAAASWARIQLIAFPAQGTLVAG